MRRLLRFHYASAIGALLVLTPSLHAPTAYSAPGDPPSGSPAGAVYRLPLQQGRADGAPRPFGDFDGSGSGASRPAGADSLYRTENNFGSSSRVPGLAAAGGEAAGAGLAAGGDGGESDEEAARTLGEGGSGGGGPAGGAGSDGDGAAGGGEAAGRVSDAGNTSVAAGAGLLGAIGLLAAGIGILSRRFSAAQRA